MSGNIPEVRAPERRLLRAFAFDPMRSRLKGRFLELNLPFEPLEPGPRGSLIDVIDYDARRELWYSPVDLDDPLVLAQSGLRPSESDPRTHQQIVYAVAMSVIERFERFTGRRFRWHGSQRLRLVPHAFYGRNAFYDPERNAVLFGYYRADETDTEANLPGQLMFTCLSVDIIAHEVTHAIVERVRPQFSIPTNPDVLAFHEGFADVVALFHHFLFRDVVEEAVAQSRSELQDADVLFDLAGEFGRSTGRAGPLRSALQDSRDGNVDPRRFIDSTEPHTRGAIFVSAVFEGYLASFTERIRDLRRLASGGTGVLASGELSPDLVARVAGEAIRTADRVLGMVIRSFDYMPPVDVTFGDVVRAIITADRDFYPDDEIHLRANLVEALRRHGIFPAGVVSLADQSLPWRSPVVPLSLTSGPGAVDLSALILDSTLRLDPKSQSEGEVADEVTERVRRLAPQLTAWAHEHAHELGLDPVPGKIAVQGMHVTFQNASDGQPRPRVVIQFTQRRRDLEKSRPTASTTLHAACTVIASVDGVVAFVVPKSLPLTAPGDIADATSSAAAAAFARAQHEAGVARLAAIERWATQVTEADPLAVWSPEPPLNRLTFGRLHLTEQDADADADVPATEVPS